MRSTLLLFPLLFALSLSAQSATKQRIAQAVENYRTNQGFSGTILVAQAGQILYHRSFGLAYYATPDTLQNNYRYHIASISKMLTSIRILQMVAADELALDQSVAELLPELADDLPPQLCLDHLLSHRSGLPNEAPKSYRHPLAPLELVKSALSRKSKSRLGTFHYNNVDYWLLGLIIEAQSGQSWYLQIKTKLLDPAQMGETGLLAYGIYPRCFAFSYRLRGRKLKQDPLLYVENLYAAGQLYSSSSDLYRLDRALQEGLWLDQEGMDLLVRSYPEEGYVGYGVWNYPYPFVAEAPKIMERRGKFLGANSVIVRIAEEDMCIIVLSNDDRFNPDSNGDAGNLREALIRSLFPRQEEVEP